MVNSYFTVHSFVHSLISISSVELSSCHMAVQSTFTLPTLAFSIICANSWRRQWHPTPVLLPGKSHGWRSLVRCSPWGHQESDTTEWIHFHFSLSCIGEGNGNPLQCSCLENPRDGGAWWAAIYGVAQSWTRLKGLSSSSSHNVWLCRKLRRNIWIIIIIFVKYLQVSRHSSKHSFNFSSLNHHSNFMGELLLVFLFIYDSPNA